MRKLFSIAALSAFSLLLAACGGSSFSGTGSGPSGTTGGGTVAKLMVSSDLGVVPPDGLTPAHITVTATDANSAAVSGVAVTITASAGTVTVTQGTTDSTGKATATLGVPTSAAPGSVITITAASASVSGTGTVAVTKSTATVSLITSLPSIPSDGSKAAPITAYVRDANNNIASGQTVGFQASSGGLTVTKATTKANGAATATLTSAGDPSNRSITVSAQVVGGTPSTLSIGVVGTKLTVNGPTTLIQGQTGTYTISLTDAGGNGVANQAITITSAAGNALTPASYTSDGTGQKTFTLSATAAGSDTITVTGAGLSATQAVSVSNQNFAFTAPANNAKANIGTTTPVALTWTAAGAPQAGKTITFSATRGTLSASTAPTDGTGVAAVTITSSQSGPSVITATSTDSAGQPVTAQTSVDFLATNPTQIKVQASPSTIATQSPRPITVTVRDPTNNLVEGKQVNFSITQDSTGGSLSVSSATTDSTGQASTVYTASTTTSASNGVVISANVAGTSVTGTTSLTVAGQTVFLSLGTGNLIKAYTPPNPPPGFIPTQYILPYSVQAVDNAGHGVNNVQIALTVTSLAYNNGFYVKGSPWAQQLTISQPSIDATTHVVTPSSDPDAYTLLGYAGCKSEDVDNNGILTSTNDYNGNVHLDPGLVAATDVSSVTTANGGSASFNIIYPQVNASWVGVRLTATATVAGTQSSTYTDFWLPGLATDYASATISPPGQFSPYGQAATCLDKN